MEGRRKERRGKKGKKRRVKERKGDRNRKIKEPPPFFFTMGGDLILESY